MKTANLESIWSEYEHAIHAFLRSKVSNEDDVDDLKQEILLKTYQNLGDIRDVSSVKSWLFQIANNAIIDFYRKRARNQRDNDLVADDLWFEEQEASGATRHQLFDSQITCSERTCRIEKAV